MATTLNSRILSNTYKDDFTDSDGYYRILFNSGRPLQARELTQMQTILQEQIKRFGANIFKEGGVVKPGERVLNTAYEFVKLNTVSYALPANPNSLIGTTFTGNTSGVTARIIEVVAAENGDPATIYVAYTNAPAARAGATTVRFAANETLSNGSVTLQVQQTNTTANPAVGVGTRISIGSGIYFVKGFFVFTEAKNHIVSKYTDDPTETVGFVSVEEVYGVDDDVNLYDNQGAVPNTSSPGADRYRITLELANKSEVTADDNFIPVLKLVDGAIFRAVDQKNSYNEVRDFVATRIKENSGDYIVKPFKIRHELDSEQSHLILNVSDGIAVVDGYRSNHYAPERIRVPKPVATLEIQNEVVAADYGNYILVQAGTQDIKGLPNLNTFEKLNIRSAANYGGSTIGTCRVKAISEDNGNFYRYYLFDIEMNAGQSFRNAVSIGTGVSDYFNPYRPAGKTVLNEIFRDDLLFPAPRIRPRSLDDISLEVQRRFQASTNPAGEASITLTATGETFANTNDWIVAKSDSDIITSGLTFSSNPVGQVAANFTNLPASSTVEILAYVNKSQGQVRSKTLNEITVTKTVDGNGEIVLGKPDLFELIRVTENDSDGRNMRSYFSLDNGQRDNYYGIAKLKLKTGVATPANPIFVRFKYFTHGTSGDFFAINSYTGQVDYDRIQNYRSKSGETYNLRNVLDFRSVVDSNGDFASSGLGARVNGIPQINDTINSDITYYLSRKDTLCIDTDGNIIVNRGRDNFTPLTPPPLDKTLPLYDIIYRPNTLDTNDVIISKYNHKRYTMKDIGLLEGRVDRLEEVTSLSLLETDTKNLQVLDSAGTDRTKSGFFVDNFTTHLYSSVNYSTREYRASIDPQRGVLRPTGAERNIKLLFDSDNSLAVVRKGDNVYLEYTEVTYFDQDAASKAIKINPFEATIYTGDIELSPSSDEWREVKYNSIKAIDGGQKLNTTHAYLWNNWEWNWGGTSIQKLKVGSSTQVKKEGSNAYVNKVAWDEVVEETLSEKVLSTAVIPYMRSRKVYFKARGLRPNSKVWAYFDGVRVDDWVREETFQRYSTQDDDYWNQHYNATEHPEGPTELTTDANGEVEGSLWIPSTGTLKFNTGTVKFEILDISEYNPNKSGTLGTALYSALGNIDTVDADIKYTRVLHVEYAKFNKSGITYISGEGGDNQPGVENFQVGSTGVFTPGLDPGDFATPNACIDWSLELDVTETFKTETKYGPGHGPGNKNDNNGFGGYGGDDGGGNDYGSDGSGLPMCLTEDMQVMLNGKLQYVTEVQVGDKVDSSIVTEVLHKHMREGYYIINGELKITSDHPVLANGSWKRTEDLVIGDIINGISVESIQYVDQWTPTVYIGTADDRYNVHCNNNVYIVHGHYENLNLKAA